jgi:hypothetical protein
MDWSPWKANSVVSKSSDFLPFMKREGLLPFSQHSAIGLYLSQVYAGNSLYLHDIL